MKIRPAEEADIPAIADIYAHHVLQGTGTFETEPPDAHEMKRRWLALRDRNFPYLVAEREGTMIGYAYAGPYRERLAYRFTVEDSVYIHKDHAGKGAGKMLLTAIISETQKLGFKQMVAVIGDSGNAASVGLHAACGFYNAGILKNVGFKFDRWLDSVLMQRAL
jgi:phosphinothricin acetyltransferase